MIKTKKGLNQFKLDAQLMEEHGSDQRLREAAKFWHEHNQKLIHNQTNNQNQQHLEHNYPFQRRIKRAEKSLNNNLIKDDSKTLNELEILTKSLNSQQRKWMKAALNEIMKEGGGGGGEQNNEDNIQDNSMVLTVIERNQNKSEAKFGHHHLPAGEQKDSATWPWQLWPFMHCLTLECICPLFRGDVSGNQCILPNGKPLQRAIRKEFRTFSSEEMALLEIVYRSFHPENTLLGEADDFGFVTNGLFANWTTMDGRHSFQRMFGDQEDGEFFNEGRIDYVLSQTSVDKVLTYSLPLHTCINYELDDRFLEYSHDYVHYFISGDMQERFSSSNDPIFFMHHGFVDSVWEMWRQKRQTRFQRERDYPRDDGECMPEWHFSDAFMPMLQPLRNLDALSNNYTDNMYEYAKRPSCPNGDSEECGNTKFLWCDVKTNIGHPVCLAKVKPGGNCKGFEWSTEICYNGQCLEGRCTRVLEQQNKKYSKYEKQQKQIDKVYEHWHTESFMRR
uniref:Tyrosinase copper-binding domain-containing protein n=1 Tax=Meloidogyne javanica TaxID=6303 RepID=A0A915N452_MELJA